MRHKRVTDIYINQTLDRLGVFDETEEVIEMLSSYIKRTRDQTGLYLYECKEAEITLDALFELANHQHLLIEHLFKIIKESEDCVAEFETR